MASDSSAPTYRLRRKKGETIESFAQRRYEAQKKHFESLLIEMQPLAQWANLSPKLRRHWITSTRTLEQERATAKEGRSP